MYSIHILNTVGHRCILQYCHQRLFSAVEIPFLYCFVGCSVELKGYEEKKQASPIMGT